jgi:hypothetical protein
MRSEGFAKEGIAPVPIPFVVGITINLEEPKKRSWNSAPRVPAAGGPIVGSELPLTTLQFSDPDLPQQGTFEGFLFHAGACSACTLDAFESFKPNAGTKQVLTGFEVNAKDLKLALKGRNVDRKTRFAADPAGSLRLRMASSSNIANCFLSKNLVKSVQNIGETFPAFEKRISS